MNLVIPMAKNVAAMAAPATPMAIAMTHLGGLATITLALAHISLYRANTYNTYLYVAPA